MQRACFALTALDVTSEWPVPVLDDAFQPPWRGKATGSAARVPVIRLFGATSEGASVCAHVHGITPHFYAEVTDSVAAALVAPGTPPPKTAANAAAVLAAPAELAAAIEGNTNVRRGARVVGLRLEWWRSAYGLRLVDQPFLRVDMSDPRDIGSVAAVLQRGEIPALGQTQPHEAHVPFLSQFLSEHHISGAGWVRVYGYPRVTPTEGASGGRRDLLRQSCCSLELDVMSPAGFPACAERDRLLQRAGRSAEARARAALRAMIDRGSVEATGEEGSTPPGTQMGAFTQLFQTAAKASNMVPRPTPGQKTTSPEVRDAIRQWLRGGDTPAVAVAQADHKSALVVKEVAEAAAAAYSQAAVADAKRDKERAASQGMVDIEDLVVVCTPTRSRRPRSPPGYSDPADDPRAGSTRAFLPMERPRPVASPMRPQAQVNAIDKEVVLSSPSKPSTKTVVDSEASPAPCNVSPASVSSPSRDIAALEWEDLAAVFALEVLTYPRSAFPSSAKAAAANPMNFGSDLCSAFGGAASEAVYAVAYAWWPHSCGRRLKPQPRLGAIVVIHVPFEGFGDAGTDLGDVLVVQNEMALFSALIDVVGKADPDVCLGWNLHTGSWGKLYARAMTLGMGPDFCGALSRAPFDSNPFRGGAGAPVGDRTAGSAGFGQRSAYDNHGEYSANADPRAADMRTSSHHGEMSNTDAEMIAPSELHLAGRMVLSVWRMLMHVTFGTKLRSFAPQEAAKEVLGRSLPLIPPAELARLWATGSADERRAVIGHLQALAKLSLEVVDHLDVLPRAGELSRLTGMDVLSGFTRGTQLRVESLLVRVAKAAGLLLLSPSKEQVRGQPALECIPMVMEPHSGHYWDPVLVLDFKSMYPSIIVAHNISYDTCMGRASRTDKGPQIRLGVREDPWQLGQAAAARVAAGFGAECCVAGDRSQEVQTSKSQKSQRTQKSTQLNEDLDVDCPVQSLASGVLFASPSVRQGLLPLMLSEVLRLRADAKAAMKATSDAAALRRLDGRQFALKYFANVTYGYCGASFSGRMPCSEVADAIVGTGRRALEEAASFIEAAEPGCKVIYGDTDSVFVHLPGASLEEAFTVGRRLSAQACALYPPPCELEFEKVYMPCLMVTKKRYAGLKYTKPPSEGGTAVFEAKGIEAVRADQCRLASVAQSEILEVLFRQKDLSAARQRFERIARELLHGGTSGPLLTDLVFHRIVRFGTYRAEQEDGGSATLPPQAAVARRAIAAEGGECSAPAYGERVAYAVKCGPPGSRLVDRCVAPEELIEGGAPAGGKHVAQLDRWWYVEKALLPPISKVIHGELCGLPAVDVSTWLHRVPRPSAAVAAATGSCKSGLGGLLRRWCKRCGQHEEAHGAGVCGSCASPELRAAAQERADKARELAASLRSGCIACAGDILWSRCKSAAYCPSLAKRAAAEDEARKAAEEAHALETVQTVRPSTEAPRWRRADYEDVFDVPESQGTPSKQGAPGKRADFFEANFVIPDSQDVRDSAACSTRAPTTGDMNLVIQESQTDDVVTSCQADERTAACQADARAGSCQADAGATSCQAQAATASCQADAGATSCQAHAGTASCQANAGATSSQVHAGVALCQANAGAPPCQAEAESGATPVLANSAAPSYQAHLGAVPCHADVCMGLSAREIVGGDSVEVATHSVEAGAAMASSAARCPQGLDFDVPDGLEDMTDAACWSSAPASGDGSSATVRHIAGKAACSQTDFNSSHGLVAALAGSRTVNLPSAVGSPLPGLRRQRWRQLRPTGEAAAMVSQEQAGGACEIVGCSSSQGVAWQAHSGGVFRCPGALTGSDTGPDTLLKRAASAMTISPFDAADVADEEERELAETEEDTTSEEPQALEDSDGCEVFPKTQVDVGSDADRSDDDLENVPSPRGQEVVDDIGRAPWHSQPALSQSLEAFASTQLPPSKRRMHSSSGAQHGAGTSGVASTITRVFPNGGGSTNSWDASCQAGAAVGYKRRSSCMS